MKRAWLTALAVTGVLVSLLLVAAPEASATLVKQPDGHYLSIALPSGLAPASVPGSVAAAHHAAGFSGPNGVLDYHDGAVMHSSAPYLIFWTPSGETVSATTQSLLEQYFTDASADSGTSSNVYSVDRQFYDGTGFANYTQSFTSGQAIADPQPYPTRDTANCPLGGATHCITDTQLQSEVERLLATDGLPADGSSSTQLPDGAPVYFVVLPTNVNVCADSSTCATNYFCAYHSSFTGGGQNVLYAAIPLLPATGKACQDDGHAQVQSPNGDSQADIAIKYMSHEDNETITDPVFGAGGGGGWWNNTGGNEDGDNCNFYGSFNPTGGYNPNAFTPLLGGSAATGNLYNQLINGNPYYIQSEWSNGDVNCEMRPSPPTGTANFTAQPGSGNSVNLAINNSFSSATWSFGDGSASFYNVGTEPSPLGHVYAAPGSYNVTLTSVDTLGNISTSTQAVTVGASSNGGGGSGGGGGTGSSPGGTNSTPGIPSAVFSTSPSSPGTGQPVSFNASGSNSAGRSIVAYAWNFGDGSTGSGAKPTHTYRKTGTYTVTLAVGDSAGQMAFVSHKVTVGKASVTKITAKNKKAGGATVLITVNAPGKVQFGSKSLRVRGAGTIKFNLKLSAGRQRTLSTTHRLSLLVTIKFTPAVGKRSTKNATIVFHT